MYKLKIYIDDKYHKTLYKHGSSSNVEMDKVDGTWELIKCVGFEMNVIDYFWYYLGRIVRR